LKWFESLILYVTDLKEARAFYCDFLGWPLLFEDDIIVVIGDARGRIVLHRNDRGHDERGIFPAGPEAGAAALRFAVSDPDAWSAEAVARGIAVLWPTQEASWGKFVVIEDPDGRPVVLARMSGISPRSSSETS
jgi:catechol 2,3-dioxygenase-like lactoylglutathione lyase family enzyme